MIEKKPHIWEMDQNNYVHTRWCQEPKVSPTQPYYTAPKTALDLLTHIARGDSHNQFGSSHSGAGILKACDACVEVLAEQEREDLP